LRRGHGWQDLNNGSEEAAGAIATIGSRNEPISKTDPGAVSNRSTQGGRNPMGGETGKETSRIRVVSRTVAAISGRPSASRR
jgi:hypothetical protein